MQDIINTNTITSLKEELNVHPIYKAVQTKKDLQCFMEHHVFSVWDFMSLVKYLQGVIAPTGSPWVPPRDPELSRFINEIVLGEESDEVVGEKKYLSHFEIYLLAMEEVGADTSIIKQFVETVRHEGLEAALKLSGIPEASRVFTTGTFGFIVDGKPHLAAAAFSLGREDIIPLMFKAVLASMGVSKEDAPIFHYYLERHIHLDEGFHGPLAMRLLEQMCGGDEAKSEEATASAIEAVKARIVFWDGVLSAMQA